MRNSIHVGNLKLSFLEKNPGQDLAILFIHGNSQAATTFHRQFGSEELASFRLLALDLPGHGLSGRLHKYSIPLMVKAISDFVQELDLKNFVIAGQSLGGHLSLQALSDIKPLGLFLSGTPPLSKPMDPGSFRAHPKFGVLYSQSVLEEDLDILLGDLYMTEEDRVAGKFEFQQTDPVFRPGLLSSISAGEFQDEMKAWEMFKGAKRILIGDGDRLINSESVQLRITDTITVPGGHNLQLETDAYTDLLSQMMNQVITKNPTIVSEEFLNG